MSLPDKIMGAIPNKLVTHNGKPEIDYNIEECFRYKDKAALEKALMDAYYKLNDNGCLNIHGFMINSNWFTFRGYPDGYSSVKYENALFSGDYIIWADSSGEMHKSLDDRPSSAALREYLNTGIPIFNFMDLPVWLFDAEVTDKLIVICIPGNKEL